MKSDEKWASKRETKRVSEREHIVYEKADMENNENGEKQKKEKVSVFHSLFILNSSNKKQGFFQCFFGLFFLQGKAKSNKKIKEESRRRRKNIHFTSLFFFFLFLLASFYYYLFGFDIFGVRDFDWIL